MAERRVVGAVQHYLWGDRSFIPSLLGVQPDGRPWAELWLGTHPHGPSLLDDELPLEAVSGPLPYLLKVLAVAEPLSLQCHPDATWAAKGYADGSFEDPNPKPELILALTPFRALCGLRPIGPTLALLAQLGLDHLREHVAAHGPGAALEQIYLGSIEASPIIDACRLSGLPEAQVVVDLDRRYPGDPSVAATLLLNLVILQPGQALQVPSGSAHAYLHGAGVELMGASDNVIRGGLTTKPVDVDRFLAVFDRTPLARPVLPDGDRFDLVEAGVALVRLHADEIHVARGHELSIAVDGNARYHPPGDTFRADIETFVVVPAQ